MQDAEQSHKESLSGGAGLLSTILRQEAALAILLPGVAYLFAYFYERAYLRHFGIPSSYVSVGIDDVLVTSGLIAASIATLYQLTWWLPYKFISKTARFLLGHSPVILLLPIFFSNVEKYGINWFTIALLAILEIFVLTEVWSVYSHWKGGGTYGTYLDRMVAHEITVRQQNIDYKIGQILGQSVWTIVLLIAVGTYLVGSIAGNLAALQARIFTVIKVDGMNFASIGSYQDGFLFTKVIANEANSYRLPETLEVMWLSNAQISGKSQLRITLSTTLGQAEAIP